MNTLSLIMLIFAIFGAVDYLFGNRLGIGKEFERGFTLLGTLALSMIGIIVISPLIASLLETLFDKFYNVLHIDPSIITASLFANDMGGAELSVKAAKDTAIGGFNAYVVSSMMGGLISFYIPFSIGVVKKEHHNELFLGLLCGTVAIPVGCFVGGLICRIPILTLILNMLPLIIFAAIIALGLWFCPKVCVKIFSVFGRLITIALVIGLLLGIVNFLAGEQIIGGLAPIENAVMICFSISVILAGAFPLMYIVSRIFKKPLAKLSEKMGVGSMASTGFLSIIVTAPPVFDMMNQDMDKKGIMLNAAFIVPAGCLLGDHLAFTLTYDEAYIAPMLAAKAISGICAVVLALIVYKRTATNSQNK